LPASILGNLKHLQESKKIKNLFFFVTPKYWGQSFSYAPIVSIKIYLKIFLLGHDNIWVRNIVGCFQRRIEEHQTFYIFSYKQDEFSQRKKWDCFRQLLGG
jgi:hypothetical protein